MSQFTPRPYQAKIIEEGTAKLKKLGIVYLSMEVRTGKTLTALGIANNMGVENVLFITKKKAITSINNDCELLSPDYTLTTINYESLHKVEITPDLIIVDEAHCLAAFPKPSKRTKLLKSIVGKKPVILLSGTPTPENYSQIFHQFWISANTPFPQSNFYKFAHSFVDIKKVYISYGQQSNDYSGARIEEVKKVIDPYMISYSQKEAGFAGKIEEEILTVPMKPITYQLIAKLEEDLVYEGKNGGVILCDTPVKLMQKVHQLSSGTVKLEDGSSKIIDKSKGKFIESRFKNTKIAIFYKFTEELNLLKEVFGDNLTTDLEEFNSTSKNIALQIVSGREGISLKNAEYLVMFNIDFSATSYWQARDRMTTKDRVKNKVYWIFSEGGIEHKIYRAVMAKKNYTLKHYNNDRSKSAVANNAIY